MAESAPAKGLAGVAPAEPLAPCDATRAEAFIRNDPFTKAGLFAGIEVVRWRKAFFNFEKLI